MGEEMAEGGSEGGMALEEASGASRNRALSRAQFENTRVLL